MSDQQKNKQQQLTDLEARRARFNSSATTTETVVVLNFAQLRQH